MGFFKRLFGLDEEEKKEREKLEAEPQYSGLKEIKRFSGTLAAFDKFIQKPGKIGIILGARGSGKSALGMKVLENIESKSNREEYSSFALGFNPKKTPEWLGVVDNINEVPNNSFLLVDESGVNFSSRSSMSNANKLLSELLLISRHKNISIIFITQNSANIEINTLRQADYLLLKKSSLLQLDFERKKIKDIYESVARDVRKLENDKGLTYIYSDVYRGFVSNSLPSFWTEGLSKSYSGVEI